MLASTSRSLATTTLRAQGTQASKRFASSIATKYSHAAYKAALSKSPNTLLKVQNELSAVAASLKSTPQLDAFVKNPLLASGERAAGLQALFKSAETATKEPVSDVTKNLFGVLSENGRLGETSDVIEGFNELVAKYKGELEIIVTSASPLPRDVLSRIEATLKQSDTAKQAKVLKVTNRVNPSVLGGFLVDVGDKTIDLSVASRVTKLNSILQRESPLVSI
ncbi:ATP5 [Sanghuangporus weigelae]